MMTNITTSLLLIGIGSFASGALFPPGDVPKQLAIAVIWFVCGATVAKLW